MHINNHDHRVWWRTCPWRSMWEMRRTWTGPGPQWAMGGDTVIERLVSAARGKVSGSPGIVRVRFTCTACDLILAKLWRDSEITKREKHLITTGLLAWALCLYLEIITRNLCSSSTFLILWLNICKSVVLNQWHLEGSTYNLFFLNSAIFIFN